MRHFILFLALLLLPGTIQAEEHRSFEYAAIDIVYSIHKDSTISVSETITHDFRGAYHQGWRTLSHRGSDRITDIRIFDDQGQELIYVSEELEKTNPDSWGKYTISQSSRKTDVIWYHDSNNEVRSWTMTYTLHGAIAFYDDRDELYWNAVADYSVMVRKTSVHVQVEGNPPPESFRVSEYPSDGVITVEPRTTSSGVFLSATHIPPEGAYTIAVGWPTGYVDKGAYVRSAVVSYWWGYLLALLVALGSILYRIIYWYRTEGRLKGRGVIVPQYEPPENLRPAMAGLLIYEHLPQRTWAATIVDLAIRGYVIIEEQKNVLGVIGAWIVLGLGMLFLTFVFSIFLGKAIWFIIPFLALLFYRLPRSRKNALFISKDYRIKRGKTFDEHMEDYEKDFLNALFLAGDGTVFSTKDMRSDPKKGRELYQWMKEVEKQLRSETADDTKAYEIPPEQEHRASWGIVVIIGVIILGAQIPWVFGTAWGWIAVAILFAALMIYMAHNDARLNLRGRILKEDWLGFHMYLETAERYRLQNLTPDTFEKLLPYAMLFNIEKKWAQAFKDVTLAPPSWYHGSTGFSSGISGSGASGGFSPAAFATGFSASFTSAFTRSGGGGASGGGGGAGGGGGGGGGGAS